MNIFINIDNNNSKANSTKEKLLKLCKKYDITITDVTNCDIIISIGGDGTFLKSAKLNDKPIIGINTGTLGYLTEINPDNLEKTLTDILNHNYQIENRMMLEGKIIKTNGEAINIPAALNEIGISKKSLGVIRFKTIVNSKLINSYTADGMLACTPTGSTAYNLSCGGPIVDPTAKIITLTPIAPHTILNRSIVLSEKSTVEFDITELRNNDTAFVLHDGKPIEIKSGDIIQIKKSDKFVKLIKLEDRSFIDTIRENIS